MEAGLSTRLRGSTHLDTLLQKAPRLWHFAQLLNLLLRYAQLISLQDFTKPSRDAIQTMSFSLLRLPRELRDMIYEQYFAVENGYLYDAELGKLTQADNSPILLCLSYTCRQVACEVRGLAFRINTITFSTSDLQREQVAAGVHHAVVGGFAYRKHIMLRSLVSQLLNRDMVRSPIYEMRVRHTLTPYIVTLGGVSSQSVSTICAGVRRLDPRK